MSDRGHGSQSERHCPGPSDSWEEIRSSSLHNPHPHRDNSGLKHNLDRLVQPPYSHWGFTNTYWKANALDYPIAAAASYDACSPILQYRSLGFTDHPIWTLGFTDTPMYLLGSPTGVKNRNSGCSVADFAQKGRSDCCRRGFWHRRSVYHRRWWSIVNRSFGSITDFNSSTAVTPCMSEFTPTTFRRCRNVREIVGYRILTTQTM